MLRYEDAFAATEPATRDTLSHMSALLRRTKDSDTLSEHIEYSQLCISLFSTVLSNPNIQSCVKEPLWWVRREYGCNCFYFEIITAVMDTASLFVTQNEPMPTLDEAQDVIWLLRWIMDKAFPDWTDGTTAKNRRHYTLVDAKKLYELCRAYAFYILFRQADCVPSLPETHACIQNLSLVLRTLIKYGPSIPVFLATHDKTALIDVANDWAFGARMHIFSLCKTWCVSKGEFAVALSCTKKLAAMGHQESKQMLDAEQKDYNTIYQGLHQKCEPVDITSSILSQFRYTGRAFENGKAPQFLPVLQII